MPNLSVVYDCSRWYSSTQYYSTYVYRYRTYRYLGTTGTSEYYSAAALRTLEENVRGLLQESSEMSAHLTYSQLERETAKAARLATKAAKRAAFLAALQGRLQPWRGGTSIAR